MKPYLFDHPNFPEILISPEHRAKTAKLEGEKKKRTRKEKAQVLFSLMSSFAGVQLTDLLLMLN